jgi:DNA primase small subunit
MYRRSSRDLREYLVSLFYKKKGDSLSLPTDFSRREFAFQLFSSKKYIRHLSFNSREDLLAWIIEKSPHSAFYSSAIYELPDAPKMSEKGWRGSELQLDIDVDHLEECSNRIYNPCEESNLDASFIEEECLVIGLQKALEARRILQSDFGMSSIEIHFSGNRGFHVLVRDKGILNLNSDERRELVDYLNGTGLDLKIVLPSKKGVRSVLPSPEDPGWRGRLARWAGYLYRKGADSIDRSYTFEELFSEKMEEIIRLASIEVDAQVTIDITRLIRIPGSINGKSGLMVARIETWNERDLTFEEFSPFKGTVKITPLCDLKFSFGGRKYSLSKNTIYRLEASLGTFLFFKGLVNIVNKGDLIV